MLIITGLYHLILTIDKNRIILEANICPEMICFLAVGVLLILFGISFIILSSNSLFKISILLLSSGLIILMTIYSVYSEGFSLNYNPIGILFVIIPWFIFPPVTENLFTQVKLVSMGVTMKQYQSYTDMINNSTKPKELAPIDDTNNSNTQKADLSRNSLESLTSSSSNFSDFSTVSGNTEAHKRKKIKVFKTNIKTDLHFSQLNYSTRALNLIRFILCYSPSFTERSLLSSFYLQKSIRPIPKL